MSAARTGAAGSASKTAASCRRLRFASTPIPSRARRRNGSRLAQDRPLFAFAGLWTPWRGVRGTEERASWMDSIELFGFLTTEPNAVVAPIHPKAMPVILTTPAEVDLWLLADAPKALELQRPLPDDALRIVASGEKEGWSARGCDARLGSRANAPALTRVRGFQPTTILFARRQCAYSGHSPEGAANGSNRPAAVIDWAANAVSRLTFARHRQGPRPACVA